MLLTLAQSGEPFDRAAGSPTAAGPTRRLPWIPRRPQARPKQRPHDAALREDAREERSDRDYDSRRCRIRLSVIDEAKTRLGTSRGWSTNEDALPPVPHSRSAHGL